MKFCETVRHARPSYLCSGWHLYVSHYQGFAGKFFLILDPETSKALILDNDDLDDHIQG